MIGSMALRRRSAAGGFVEHPGDRSSGVRFVSAGCAGLDSVSEQTSERCIRSFDELERGCDGLAHCHPRPFVSGAGTALASPQAGGPPHLAQKCVALALQLVPSAFVVPLLGLGELGIEI